MMFRSSIFQQLSQIPKQLIIQSLKNEFFQLKGRQQHSLSLQSQIGNIQSKYELLQDEKSRIQSQNKIKLQVYQKHIIDLQEQSDILRMQIQRLAVEIQEVLKRISHQKLNLQPLQSEMNASDSLNQEIKTKNINLVQEIRVQAVKLNNTNKQKYNLQKENEGFIRSLQDHLSLLQNLQKEAHSFQASNVKMIGILENAQVDKAELMQQMKNREYILAATYTKLDNINLQIESLLQILNQRRQEFMKAEQDLLSVTQDLQIMQTKNQKQESKIMFFQNKLIQIENEIQLVLQQKNAFLNQREGVSAQNELLKIEIDQTMRSIIDAQRMSGQLQHQVQNYFCLDEQARNLLFRKEKALKMIDSQSTGLAQTKSKILHFK